MTRPVPPLVTITLPHGPEVIDDVLSAVAHSLDGGPAVLPLPLGPTAVRDRIVTALRPDEPLDGDAALIVPTSGSTGPPRGVLLPADAIRASAAATHTRLGGPGRWLLALPATHVAGLMVLARSVVAGTTPRALDLRDGFDPDAFVIATARLAGNLAARRYTALVPAQLSRLLDAGGRAVAALAEYDAVLIGGAAAPPMLVDRAREAGVNIVITYGMTETCGGCVYDGVPLDGVTVDVAPLDQLLSIAGDVLASGYRLRPDLTAHAFTDGWFRTSDLGIVENGVLQITGRADDVAISGGVNVPLATVDAALTRVTGVLDAAATAVNDVRWGQRIVAVVIPRDPEDPPTLQSIRTLMSQAHPAAYIPKELVLVESLPTLPSGKVDRRALADLL